ncbi:MAG: helix-turn-helix transcriptional regulator [Chlorobia bacterium]|nr:helix-turn-helix transcriptional regulator [Fimbriimonadaceae bacterium]
MEPWCLHLYRYQASIKIGNETYTIAPGSMGITPGATIAEYRFHDRSTHGFIHFQPAGNQPSTLAPMLPLGESFAASWAQFEEALGLFPLSPLRAEIKIWDLLWQHAERSQLPAQGTDPIHPAVAQATRFIETWLTESVTISDIAQRLDVSHNHLTRLFQKHLGKSPIAYLIERRLERAEHLLKHTNMPVKQIAIQVGIHDLQAFNKSFRNRFGVSPREYRWNPSESST